MPDSNFQPFSWMGSNNMFPSNQWSGSWQHGSPGAGTSGGFMTPANPRPDFPPHLPPFPPPPGWPPMPPQTGNMGQVPPWMQGFQNQLGQFRNSMETWENQRPAPPAGGINQGNMQPFMSSFQNWMGQRPQLPAFSWMHPGTAFGGWMNPSSSMNQRPPEAPEPPRPEGGSSGGGMGG